ncbi:thiosulfate sulfurtransferase GlpE [Shewanella psychropiezotolerans]|uniref:Thiosulfate sulfurtransferase GlpE n=1 Tax=Shewanella psychropiezotolerans TaxID=2593655 RepID=A0ABX5WY77_9GAMM|nr:MULTISPECIES: thiosulfate sulfurtransferase GlpE [Shewanella]MPY25308.1 thiosulfate sulfurtransferase GlpE [Shewanella sp. YLB-07]QDO81981.1 thiosulfate sulfurtransferase GlpE [Shewanella psychropiezotolerans]
MSNFQHFSVNQLIQLSESHSDIQIVDIRDAASFASGHVEGAINLNNENLASFVAEADMDQPLIVVCYHGISSQGAAQYLVEQGFDDVYSLDGGYQAWHQAHA